MKNEVSVASGSFTSPRACPLPSQNHTQEAGGPNAARGRLLNGETRADRRLGWAILLTVFIVSVWAWSKVFG